MDKNQVKTQMYLAMMVQTGATPNDFQKDFVERGKSADRMVVDSLDSFREYIQYLADKSHNEYPKHWPLAVKLYKRSANSGDPIVRVGGFVSFKLVALKGVLKQYPDSMVVELNL